MSIARIAWQDGSGDYITVNPGEGVRTDDIVISSPVDEDLDREQDITVKTTSGLHSATITVKQIGKREPYECADGDFILADEGTFNVLKSLS